MILICLTQCIEGTEQPSYYLVQLKKEKSRFKHQEEIMNNIQLVQFDRTVEAINSCRIENNTRGADRQEVVNLLPRRTAVIKCEMIARTTKK